MMIKEKIKMFAVQIKDKITAFIKKWTKLSTWEEYILPENPQEHIRMVRFLFLILFLVITMIGFWFLVSFFVLKAGNPKVRVPSVTNSKVLNAVNIIQSENLKIRLETRYDNHYDIYTIISQQPKAGVVTREGREVILTVSLGKDLYEVPAICGLTKEKGLSVLEKENIPYTIQTVTTTNDAETILALDMPPGTKTDRSHSLLVTVSENKNPERFTMENFVRQPLEFTATTLYNYRIAPIIITTNVDSIEDDGIVLEQNVAEGVTLEKNSSVIITVGLYAQDSGEKDKLRWYALNYYIPRPETSGQLEIDIQEDGTTNITTPDAPTAKYYKAILEDELGRTREIYERLGSEGTVFTRVFKAYGKATVTVFADNEIIGTRSYGN